MNNLMDFINNVSEKEYKEFLANANAKVEATTKVHRVISDTSWITMIEDSIPYLDNIIRNPRRFIVQEENIVPIEKTKVVTEESIRHLAQNTNLIQDVDEDGTVIPLKLLNVYREETTDLYENRFIKSLVDNLYQFVNNKLAESDQKSKVDVNNEVLYTGECGVNNGKINIEVKLNSNSSEELADSKDGHSLETRIEHIKEVLAAFMGSQFIKSLQSSQPVRSPIRKTNVILKEQNFIKALELWEYLEANAIKPLTSVTDEEIDRSKDIKDKYDFAFFIQNAALKLNKDANYDKVKVVNDLTIGQALHKLAFDEDFTEKEVKEFINREVKAVFDEKRQEERKIKKYFSNLVKEYEERKQRALDILK